MTPRHADEILSLLKQKPLGLDELHDRVRLMGGQWSRDQLELFLLCAQGVLRDETGAFHSSAPSAQDDLATALLEAVRSFGGKPVPATAVRARLPPHFVTTDAQVLAVARRTAGLEVVGSSLIRITN